jgi:hypothetical protein
MYVKVFFISVSLIPFQTLMSPKDICHIDLALLNTTLPFAQRRQKCLFFSFRKNKNLFPCSILFSALLGGKIS